MEIQNGRGQIIQEPKPTTAVAIIMFVCGMLFFIAAVTYHKWEDKKISAQIKKELNEKDSLILVNKGKDAQIAKLTFDSKDASILQKKLDLMTVENDTSVAHSVYWEARHGRVKVALKRERAKNKDTSVSIKK